MDLQEAKSTIELGIETERAKMNEKYNSDIEDLNSVETIPEILKQLVNIYGNTTEQREVMSKIINDSLQSSFFRDVDVVKGANYLVFRDENHSVSFSTTRSFEIIVNQVSDIFQARFRYDIPELKEEILSFMEMWDIYKETGKGYSSLAEDYYKATNKKRPMWMFISKLDLKKEIAEYAESVEENIQKREEALKVKEREDKEIEEKIQNYKTFVEEIKVDLEDFKKHGWRVKIIN